MNSGNSYFCYKFYVKPRPEISRVQGGFNLAFRHTFLGPLPGTFFEMFFVLVCFTFRLTLCARSGSWVDFRGNEHLTQKGNGASYGNFCKEGGAL